MKDSANLSLIVRKNIAAHPTQVFQAWTKPPYTTQEQKVICMHIIYIHIIPQSHIL